MLSREERCARSLALLLLVIISTQVFPERVSASGADVRVLFSGRPAPVPDYNSPLTPITLPINNVTVQSVRNFTAPIAGNGLGLAFDGHFLYYTLQGDNNIYVMTPFGNLQTAIPVHYPNGTRFFVGGLVYDPTTNGFWGGSWDGRAVVAQIAYNGTVMNSTSVKGLLASVPGAKLWPGNITGVALDLNTGNLFLSDGSFNPKEYSVQYRESAFDFHFGSQVRGLTVDPLAQDTELLLLTNEPTNPSVCGVSVFSGLVAGCNSIRWSGVPLSPTGMAVDHSSFGSPVVWLNNYNSPNKIVAVSLATLPAPVIAYPGDTAVIDGNTPVIAVDSSLNAYRDDAATFSYSSDGTSWTTFASASSGIVTAKAPNFPVAPLTVNGEWTGMLQPALLPGGWHYIRANVNDTAGNAEISNIIRVYTNPAPPLPAVTLAPILQVAQGASGLYKVTASTPASNIVNYTLFIKPLQGYFNKGVPVMDQRNKDYAGGTATSPFPNGGNVYCGPTSAAASFLWWAMHGYPGMVGGQDASGNPISLTGPALISGLAAKLKTNATTGTTDGNMASGLRDWIKEHGGGFHVYYKRNPNITDYVTELVDFGEDVLWSSPSHWVTANSVNSTKNADGTYTIDFMDPWSSRVNTTTMTVGGTMTSFFGQNTVSDSMFSISPWQLPCFLCGTILASTTTQTGGVWSLNWDTSSLSPGTYFLNAFMLDSSGHYGVEAVAVSATPAPATTTFLPSMILYAAVIVSAGLLLYRIVSRRRIGSMLTDRLS